MMDNPLTAFFRPRGVALVGASDKSAWSTMIHSRFAKFGHQGRLFAVNRGGAPAHGLPGFTSCRDIPEPVERRSSNQASRAITTGSESEPKPVTIPTTAARAGPGGATSDSSSGELSVSS